MSFPEGSMIIGNGALADGRVDSAPWRAAKRCGLMGSQSRSGAFLRGSQLNPKDGGMLPAPGMQIPQHALHHLAPASQHVNSARTARRSPLRHEPQVPQVTQSLGEHLITQARNQAPQFTVATRPLVQIAQDGGLPLAT